jgi:serine phosphatase RsbU (regulator of sigma subunit)
MAAHFFLTEEHPDFVPHESLYDAPRRYDCGHADLAVFYLPADGRLGGDAFTVASDSTLAVGMLADLQGHGVRARFDLTPVRQELDAIVLAAACKPLVDITTDIYDLDALLQARAAEHAALLSFSLVQLTNEGLCCYLHGSENEIWVSGPVGAQRLSTKSHSFGKLGRLDRTAAIFWRYLPVSCGDSILLCTDGVAEYAWEYSMPLLQDVLRSGLTRYCDISNLMIRINEMVASDLAKPEVKAELLAEGIRGPADDYTMLGFQLKKLK